eukprot:TRINITY_DN4947_c0_g1_i1.p2 TRINITY_DN4947_c0_g1~~TRINITY_DN4947_c0_g1_i1.p2  ORF type:complete len:116 (+),score=16.37 TRINITY_DN4947_c0_g1_i1:114-461(+)
MLQAKQSSGTAPKPPQKGSFPLDHFGDCKQYADEYLACLKRNGNESIACKEQSKAFLVCRTETGLMAKEDLEALGLDKKRETEFVREPVTERKEARGFVAGATLRRKSQAKSSDT